MFDTNKIRRIMAILEKIPNEFDNVYIVPEVFIKEAAALFRRLKIPVTAIMHDTTSSKETWGFPVVKTAEASANFNERTALIILVKKSVPLIQTTFDFEVRGKTLTVPAFVMTNEEAAAIYDHVILKRLMDMYAADGITDATKIPFALAQRFARGLMGIVHPHFQNFKYTIWDSREIFKPTYDFDDTAIVIQGPIAYDNNYTVETFKLYRLIYPNAPIDEAKLPETSWRFAAEYLILIDREAILADWPKYENTRYKAFTNSGRHSAFSRWLDMYRNFKIDWV